MADVIEAALKSAPVFDPEKIIALDKPIKVGELEYSQLALCEPTAGQLENVDGKTGVAWTIALVSEVSGMLPQVVRKLPIRILNEAAEYLVPFTRNVRPTGRAD